MAGTKVGRRVTRRRDDDNPRGYIRYRGRLIASAPYFAHGVIVPKRKGDNPRKKRRDDNPLWRTSTGRYAGPETTLKRGVKVTRALKHRGGGGWTNPDNNPRGHVRIGGRWRKITDFAIRRGGRIVGYRFPRGYKRAVANPSDDNVRRARRDDNPRRRLRLLANPVAALKAAVERAFSMDTLETVFHTALGFGGTAVGSRLLFKKVIPVLGESAVGRVATTLGVSVLGSGLIGMVTGDARLATRFLAGGMLTTVWQGLSEALPAEAKEFIPTLGEAPETEEFRKAIEAEVLKELRGGAATATQERLTYLQPMGMQAYLTQGEAGKATGVSAYMTETEASEAGMGEAFSEIGGGRHLPERF